MQSGAFRPRTMHLVVAATSTVPLKLGGSPTAVGRGSERPISGVAHLFARSDLAAI